MPNAPCKLPDCNLVPLPEQPSYLHINRSDHCSKFTSCQRSSTCFVLTQHVTAHIILTLSLCFSNLYVLMSTVATDRNRQLKSCKKSCSLPTLALRKLAKSVLCNNNWLMDFWFNRHRMNGNAYLISWLPSHQPAKRLGNEKWRCFTMKPSNLSRLTGDSRSDGYLWFSCLLLLTKVLLPLRIGCAHL